MTIGEDTISRVIEDQEWIDHVAGPVQRPVHELLERTPLLRTILDGTWLRHPLHAALTDVPIGAWTAGMVLDVLDLLGINRTLRRGADAAQTIGLASALGAALAGLADWSYTDGQARRVGFVHGLTNTLIAALSGGSILARSRGNRGTGIALSGLGWGLLLFSSWLGGHLAYRFGIGVNRNAFQQGPQLWEPTVAETEIREGVLRRVEAAGMPILLTRYQGQIYAIGDTCTHLGCSLSEGKLEGDCVECRCHGSHFRVTDGQVLVGPATVSEPCFEVRVQRGRVEVRQAQPGARPTPSVVQPGEMLPQVETPEHGYEQGQGI